MNDSHAGEVATRCLASLADIVRRAHECTAPAILSALATLLLRASTSTVPAYPTAPLPGMTAGYPFLALLRNASHLQRHLAPPLTTLLAAIAAPTREEGSSLALLSHLGAFLLACLSSETAIATHAVATLLQAAAAKPAVAAAIDDIFATFLCLAASCPPSVLPPSVPKLAWALADRSAQAEAGSPPPWKFVQPLLQLTLHLADSHNSVELLAAPLVSLLSSRALPAKAAADAVCQLSQALASRAYTASEESLLFLLHKALCAAEAEPCPEVHLLAAQLQQHVSVPTDSGLYAVASLSLPSDDSPLTAAGPLATDVQGCTSAALTALLDAGHQGETVRWLRHVMQRALATLGAVQRTRAEALCTALSSGTVWPVPVPSELTDDSALDSKAAPAGERPPAAVFAVLSHLVSHGHAQVRRHAASALAAAALSAPSTAAALVPWAVRTINGTMAATNGSLVDAERCLVPFALLAAVCASPHLEPMLLAVAAPLLDDKAPPEVRALGIRLLLTFWQATNRGWHALSAALAACGPAYGRVGDEAAAAATLTLAVATAVAAVARTAPQRCMDNIGVVGGLLVDARDAVVALALEALYWLCYYVRYDPTAAADTHVQLLRPLSCTAVLAGGAGRVQRLEGSSCASAAAPRCAKCASALAAASQLWCRRRKGACGCRNRPAFPPLVCHPTQQRGNKRRCGSGAGCVLATAAH